MFVVLRIFVKFERSGHAKFYTFGKSQNGRSIDQERFKLTLPMPVDHRVTTLGSSMNGFQWV